MIKIAICDDDEMLTSKLESLIEKIAKIKGIHIDIDIFFNGQELLNNMKYENDSYDIIYLDIEMDRMNGLEVAREIRKSNKVVLLIFVTLHSNYAIDAYEVHPFNFIVKPFFEDRVFKVFNEAYENIINGNFYYRYMANRKCYKILLNDIIYFESQKRKITIHLTNGIQKQYYDKMDAVQKKLEQVKGDFWRIHQSILVNAKYIVSKGFDHIELSNGQILNISEDRRKEINEQYIGNINR